MANIENSSSGARVCVGCGAELAANASPSLCPKCLFKLAMKTEPAAGAEGTVTLFADEPVSVGLPQPGEQFGHYKIIRALGAGGMGTVYEAQDQENGRRIALKVLSHKLDSPDARERFFREGRLAASINHPNSVYIFGTEEIGGTPVIAMELVGGGTLQERVAARGPLPIGEAVDSVLQVIEGLEAAQRVGVLHRDVKPSNCFVGEEGAVKIGDFGLSISTVRADPALTVTGAFLGTPAFCSPEQLRGDELNVRSDMYSVGTTLYFLLTGRTPFEAKGMVQLLSTLIEQRAPSPRKFRPDIPQELAGAVQRCLEKQPGERFKNYADLARALAPYGSAAPTPATLGLRFVAGVLDIAALSMLVMLVTAVAFGTPMALMEQQLQHHAQKMLGWAIGWAGVVTLYFTVFEGIWGAAAGKAIFGLRVVGPNRSSPGFARACLRGVIFMVLPFVPYVVIFFANPENYFNASTPIQMLLAFGCYLLMAMLFITARRRNGFAAVQDLLTGTRVVSRAGLASRHALAANEAPSPSVAPGAAIGPYHVLQTLADTADGKWILGYDLKLLRKVWVRVAPPGTEAVPGWLHNLSRVGRLRWLTGKRSPDENWDAFESLSGRSLLDLIREPQPWSDVRYWLSDLAGEISAAQKDGTVPDLALDRVWITGEGRAKLLDFPAPRDVSPAGDQLSPPASAIPPLTPRNDVTFLCAVATSALTGQVRPAIQPAGGVPARLPLHARAFLERLPQLPGAADVAAAMTPLLSRVPTVSRGRRAALVAGCSIFPLLAVAAALLGLSTMQQVEKQRPGLMELSAVLRLRASAASFAAVKAQLPPDRLVAIYIAQHYRGIITNEDSWSSPFTWALIKGEDRKFAERSMAQHPTDAEIKEAEAAVGPRVPKFQPSIMAISPSMPALMTTGLLVDVCLPAMIATLLFRGGLIMLLTGVTFVRKDGQRASRLRMLFRGIVTWSPLAAAFGLSIFAMVKHLTWAPWLGVAIFALLTAWSIALPERGLQDRLAGTWPVPR